MPERVIGRPRRLRKTAAPGSRPATRSASACADSRRSGHRRVFPPLPNKVTREWSALLSANCSPPTEAGRRLFSGFATSVADGAPVRRADDINTANISVLDHHGELLALWEGGSASVLDRETLQWQGFKVWGESLEGLPFTAHPKVEPDGTLWAFGYNLVPVRALVLYHIAADGTVLKAQALDPGPLGIVHDFVVTARHLVIVIPPLVYEPSHEGELLDALVWRPSLGTRVLVVDKNDFSARRWVQLPAAFGFHHGNGWEDAGGVIRYDHCVADDAALMTGTMRGLMRGELMRESPERYTRFTLYPDGRADVDGTDACARSERCAPHHERRLAPETELGEPHRGAERGGCQHERDVGDCDEWCEGQQQRGGAEHGTGKAG